MPEAQNSRKTPYRVVIAIALALVTFAIYWPVRQFDYTNYDDQDYASENAHVQSGLTADGVHWAFTTGFASNWHPLTWLSLMLDVQLFGDNPGGHHFMNVVYHVLATIMLFLVLAAMTGAPGRSGFVAALFALHPLHVESVAWIAERKDVLSGLFWMLTMAAYVSYVRKQAALRYIWMCILYGLGLMAKPMLVTLPCALLLLDYWPLQRGLRWLEKLPLLGLSVASSLATFIVQRG